MSSSIDQRASKQGESHVNSPHQANDIEYSYPPTQAVAIQSGYHPGAGLGGQADPTYQMYGGGPDGLGGAGFDPTYMAFNGGMIADPSAVWSTDPSMAYGGYGPAEYLPYGDGTAAGSSSTGGQYGMMPAGQYDYSAVSWFPTGMDYGAAWGQSGILPIQQPTKSRFIDYSTGYYDGMAIDNSVVARGNVAGQQASGSMMDASRYGTLDMNGYNGMDQAFRSMQLSPPAAVPLENGGERNGIVGGYLENSVALPAPTVGAGDVGPSDASNKPSAVAEVSSTTEMGGNTSQQKKSWANVASLPAAKTTTILPRPKQPNALPRGMLAVSAGVRQEAMMNSRSNGQPAAAPKHQERNANIQPPVPGQYNPKDFDVSAKGARFFVIKSFSEDDIHRSIKYSIWCSTEYGNKRLDAAYRERESKGPIYLFFSVNGSGHFCGVAMMTSPVDYQASSSVWQQDKWKGTFSVQWIFVKDVPNSQLRHIRLENNEGKPVTNSRDTQEVPSEKGRQVLRIIHQYRHTTSIFDDFQHYEKSLGENGATATANNNNNNSSSENNNSSTAGNNSTNGDGNSVNANKQSTATASSKATSK